MPAHKRFYTEKQLSDKYDISRHTSIKVVHELENEGLLYRQQGKGTFVRDQEVEAKKYNILLFVAEMTAELPPEISYIHSELVGGVIDELSKKHNATVSTIPQGVDETLFCIDRIQDPAIDGVILMAYKNLKSLVTIARRCGKPYVLLNVKCDEKYAQSNNILTNESQGMCDAVKYLYGLGHRNIAFLGNERNALFLLNRKQGYMNGIIECGISDSHIFDFFPENPKYSFNELFKINPGVTGIVVANDEIAFELMNYCKMHDISVPDQLSIVGFNDATIAHLTQPKLTTVRKKRHEMGILAVHKMLNMLESGSLSIENTYIPAELIIRGSTAEAPGGIFNTTKSINMEKEVLNISE